MMQRIVRCQLGVTSRTRVPVEWGYAAQGPTHSFHCDSAEGYGGPLLKRLNSHDTHDVKCFSAAPVIASHDSQDSGESPQC